MLKPSLHPQEAERVAALTELRILDTPPEERFDRFTRLAKRLFDVPVALISLVDSDRVWFKSRQGLEATEAPREVSFCAHAILQDDVMIVEDAAKDERFHDNPLVRGEPRYRFYAGNPLRTEKGFALGALCLLDYKPRRLSSEDLATFRDLAKMVESELAALRLATTDELTGLTNRRGFNALADHSCALVARLNATATLLLFDLDGFKAINDQRGHAQGDRALVDFARALVSTFRDADVVARIGGDEFCVLTASDEAALEAPLRRLRAQLEAQQDRPYRLDFSVGAVRFDPGRHGDVDSLVNEADQLMYDQKRSRKAHASAVEAPKRA